MSDLLSSATDYAERKLEACLLPQTITAIYEQQDIGWFSDRYTYNGPYFGGQGGCSQGWELPRGPIISITSVTDTNGNAITYIDQAADNMKEKAKELFAAAGKDAADAMSGDQAQRIFEYFDNVKAQADATSKEAIKAHEAISTAFVPPAEASENAKKIADAIAELHKQVDTFGQSEGAKKLYELKLLGAGPEAQKEAQQLVDQLDTLKQQADVTKELEKLRKDAAQAGMDDAQKMVDNLKSLHANDDQIKEAQQLQQQIEDTNKAKAEAKRLDEEAKKAKEDSLTPMQKEREQLLELQKLYQSGRITAEEYVSAAAKKDAELHGEEHHTQASATRGTQEAFKLMNEINNRSRGGDKKEKIAEAQLNAQQKTLQALQDLTKRLAPKPETHVRIAVA